MGTNRERRIATAIVLVTLALVAYFTASGAMALVGRSLLAASEPDAPDFTPPRAGLKPSRSDRDATAMLARNIFDSATGDLTKVATAATSTDAEPAFDDDSPPTKCDGPSRLVAAVTNPRVPEWSFAAIADAGGKTMLFRVGNDISGRRIESIEPSRVVLRPSSGGRRCELTMFSPVTAAAPVAMAAPVDPAASTDMGTPPVPTDSKISPEELQAGVTRISDTKFSVTRGLVTKLLENQSEIMRSARIIPHEEDGRVVGVKLYGIRRNSLLGTLGLQNGDMLRTLNGFDMTSPDKALEAYARLQTASNITLSAVRRGQPLNVEYGITE
jgi:general secretion pathway protein C